MAGGIVAESESDNKKKQRRGIVKDAAANLTRVL